MTNSKCVTSIAYFLSPLPHDSFSSLVKLETIPPELPQETAFTRIKSTQNGRKPFQQGSVNLLLKALISTFSLEIRLKPNATLLLWQTLLKLTNELTEVFHFR